jgi:hypothetical protein
MVKSLLTSPYLDFVSGVILLLSGVAESWQDYQEVGSLQFGIHHGVILFSLAQILKSLPDIFEGFEYISHVRERE